MGGSSSSRSSSSNTSHVDNSYTETHYYTDQGAIEVGETIALAGIDTANNAIDAVGQHYGESLQFAEDVSQNAMSIMANSLRDDDTQTIENVSKYAFVAAGVIGVAYAIGRIK